MRWTGTIRSVCHVESCRVMHTQQLVQFGYAIDARKITCKTNIYLSATEIWALRRLPQMESCTDTTCVTGTIGITEYASKALGDVVFVELPEVGMECGKGDTIGAVESVKSASDIMSPVSGQVTEVNEVLSEKPGTINKGPEGEGWYAKIELTDVAELEGLMSKEDYDAFEK